MASKDFFVSYTGADQAWAEWIAETLEEAGHSTVLQAWDFRPGENFLQRMNQALEEAGRVLAVLSSAYFQSEYARDEWTAALVRDRGQADRFLPVRVAQSALPPLLANRVYIDLVDLEEQVAAERLVAGVQSGRARPAGKRPFPGGVGRIGTAGAARFPGRRPAIFNVQPRNPNFTGRGELLQTLRRQLAETATGAVVQAEAIHGLGGVGKTQLAIEYAHRFAADYELVWWIPAEEPVAIRGRLAALARRLGLPELPNLEDQVSVLFDELGQRDRWLLVYDNATEPAALDGLRPPAGNGHLLITSRNPGWKGVAATVGVDGLSRDEALGFLRQRGGLDEQAAAPLADALGNLPLALEQAAAYMEATSTAPDDYLQLLRERAGDLLALGEPSNYQHTIATTWSVALEQIRKQTPVAEDLLRLCSLLAPDDIPRRMLVDHPQALPERLQAAVQDQISYQQAVGELTRYSLVTVTADSIFLHRLVQAVVRTGLDQDGLQHWAGASVRLVSAAFPAAPEQVDAWPACARLLPHAIATTSVDRDVELTESASLLDQTGRYLWGRAEYARAKEMFERALATTERDLGPDHLDLAVRLSNLAIVHRALGDLSAARAALERALAIYEARLGRDQPDTDTARILNNLANVLRDQGDLDGARTLYERTLAIREARLGPDHPSTARILHNLASVLYDQGDLDAARSLYERALAIYEARLGPDHPDTATSLNNLAIVLRNQGDLEAARTLHERALSSYEARLGPDHPDTAQSLNTLANVLYDQGDLEAARTLHERALAIREARLGPDHADTAESLNNLAIVLRNQGDLEAARTLHERALAIREARLGPDHPATLRSRQRLAAVVTELEDHT